MLEIMFSHCAGLDVHKKSVTACVITPKTIESRKRGFEIKTFKTTTRELRKLKSWLDAHGVTHVAMESTGVYWKPVYNVLSTGLEIWVVNAQHIKQVPGRKTDVKDAEWIASLMRVGLLKNSFIPKEEQRDLRDLTRYRTKLTNERTNMINRVQKILEDAKIKLASVVSNMQGVSAQEILRALIAGEQSPLEMAELARGRMKAKIPQLVAALDGLVRPHHRFFLKEQLDHIDEINQRLLTLNQRIAKQVSPHKEVMDRLCGVPGIGPNVAQNILAEIGATVDSFPSAKHLASWACLCPGNQVSAGKRQSGRTRKGQKWLRTALVEAAWGAARSADTYLSAQFHRIAARRGKKRAAVAVAHSLLVIVYHLLSNPEATFYELGGDYFYKRSEERSRKQAIKQLEILGYEVSLS